WEESFYFVEVFIRRCFVLPWKAFCELIVDHIEGLYQDIICIAGFPRAQTYAPERDRGPNGNLPMFALCLTGPVLWQKPRDRAVHVTTRLATMSHEMADHKRPRYQP